MIPPYPDKLIINGQEFPLAYSRGYPAKYLHNKLPLAPKEYLVPCNPIRVSDSPKEMQATWEIRQDVRLYLMNLNSTAFKLAKATPLLADWVSGVIHLPDKQEIHLKHGMVVKHFLLNFLASIRK